jgi:hypothetical protein
VSKSVGVTEKLRKLHIKYLHGARGCAVRWGSVLQAGRAKIRFPEFFTYILPTGLLSWGWPSLWQKWLPGIIPGGKGGRCVGLTNLSLSCADCLEIWVPIFLKYWSLNLLKPYGPVKACNGIVLPLPLTLSLIMSYICGAPCKARNFNVVYGPTFENAESRLFLFAAQCFNTEFVQKVILWHSFV